MTTSRLAKSRILLSLPILMALIVSLNLSVHAQANGTTERVSVASDGLEADGLSLGSSISADGRYVAFVSYADNLVPGDTNESSDIFVHDRVTGETTRVSVASDGSQANRAGGDPAISADGRYVAFVSFADNLVPGDTNESSDIFVHDRVTGETTRVSVASDGSQGTIGSYSNPSISADGRYVAYSTNANGLIPDDNGGWDVFVHDRVTGETTRVSVASDGSQGTIGSYSYPSISADGRFVAFSTDANGLIPDDNGGWDVFVHDRVTGETTRVSVASDGLPANNSSEPSPSISADGRYVAFVSYADNLVPGDTNLSWDIFVHDRMTGETTRVSVASDGSQGNSDAFNGFISAGGRYVAFVSYADNLVPGDTNGTGDIFVHDRVTGETTRVSVASDGSQGNQWSGNPSISADGRYVAFMSPADNLVPGDTNGTGDIFVHDRGTDTPPPPSSTPSPTPTPTPQPIQVIEYFALGDSIASGHGLMAGDVGCRQSDDAYPWVVTRTLEREYGVQVNFDGHFFACSGATATTDLLVQVTQLKNYLLEHPPGEGSLIVVSITIGAGDLGWADPDTFYNRLYRANNNQFIRWADRRIADVEAELNRQLGALLMASPDLIVILTDVYNPFSPELESVFFHGPGKTCLNPSAIPIYTDCYLKTDYAINSLNTALESTANQSQFSGRVHFVEIHEQFKGHEAPQPWCGLGGTGPNIGTTWIQYPAQGAPFDSNWFPPRSIRTDPRFQANDWTTGDCFHPNYEGAEVIANTVVNRIVQALQP